ncbi:MAG: Na+/H+ antiporter [Pseudomonadota bacterium]
MDNAILYIMLFGIIVFVGQIFNKSTIPISLLLVITGMVLSFVPHFPQVSLNPTLILNIFLPVLIYQISSFTSWKDFKNNMRPIALLSVGHVIFITFLVAIVIYELIPQLGWPLAFVLGAVISPPDDVAIVSIADKVRMPERVLTILEGEGMLNDATALIIFRIALAAVVTHEFSAVNAVGTFIVDVIGETIYGLALGYGIGLLRTRIDNSVLHIIASVLTPFIAYIPPEQLGGSGILATVVTGFVIGNVFSIRFTPEFRLVSRAVWPALAFAIQSILFLLVGLEMRFVMESISSISLYSLLLYSGAVVATVIIGRFFWVYIVVAFLPRFLFPFIRKKDPYPPWQYPLIVSWAGMRGAISLAAALAVPSLPAVVEGANARELLVFLVFSVILVTLLVQGLTLPWLLKVINVRKYGQREKYNEHLAELNARMQMTKAVLRWLKEYKKEVQDDPKYLAETKLHIQEYKMLKTQLMERIKGHHDEDLDHDEALEAREEICFLEQMINIERQELIKLWRKEKVNITVATKLLNKLDHRISHLA